MPLDDMTREQLIAALTASREAHADTLASLHKVLAVVGPIVDLWAETKGPADGYRANVPGPTMYLLAATVRDARPISRPSDERSDRESIRVELDGPNGPRVLEHGGGIPVEAILDALPAHLTVHPDDWANGVHVNGGWIAYPLSAAEKS